MLLKISLNKSLFVFNNSCNCAIAVLISIKPFLYASRILSTCAFASKFLWFAKRPAKPEITRKYAEIADELKQFLNTDDIDMYLTKYRDAINMDDHLALSKTIEDLKIVQEELQEIGKNNKADIMDDNIQSALHRMGTLLTSFRKNFTELVSK